ncbi:MAG: hypothetical protein R2798_11150 [Chitinophagales bacterium]|nr:hypothetical protein [Bacteroidota bacterium]MCB9043236.1 hypothetical protein [Chitinophagales bacterium]
MHFADIPINIIVFIIFVVLSLLGRKNKQKKEQALPPMRKPADEKPQREIYFPADVPAPSNPMPDAPKTIRYEPKEEILVPNDVFTTDRDKYFSYDDLAEDDRFGEKYSTDLVLPDHLDNKQDKHYKGSISELRKTAKIKFNLKDALVYQIIMERKY